MSVSTARNFIAFCILSLNKTSFSNLEKKPVASLAQLVEHALRKRMVMGSIPIGGYMSVSVVFAGPRAVPMRDL